MSSPRLLFAASAAALALCIAMPALALPVGYSLDISVEDDGGGFLGATTYENLQTAGLISQGVDENGNPQAFLNDVAGDPVNGWAVLDWDSAVKLDPYITNNFVVTNNTGGTATFTVAVASPIPLFNASSIVQSTIQLSVLDSDGVGGATVTSLAPNPVYQGTVNGTTELSFFPDPYMLGCANPVDCTLNGSDAAGVVSQAFGPVGATSIGITIQFTLTDGDSASVLSRFEIVPEPGTGVLLGLALLGALGLRGRASA